MSFRALVPVEVLNNGSKDLASYYAPLGDYIGGVVGTLIGALTLLIVLMTWRSDSYKNRREKAFECVFELLRAHDCIVQGIQPLKKKPDADPFGGIHSEFNLIYKLIPSAGQATRCLSLEERVGIAYIYTYFGPFTEAFELAGKHYGVEITKMLHDAIQQTRNKDGSKGYLAGHQQSLSHYFRNLYTIYRFISESGLSRRDKKLLARVTRSRLTNYEQALLVLNAMSPLGIAWKETGLMKNFQPVSNVPRLFFSFDPQFDLKRTFPYIQFEWQEYYPRKRRTWRILRVSLAIVIRVIKRSCVWLLRRVYRPVVQRLRSLIQHRHSPEPPP